ATYGYGALEANKAVSAEIFFFVLARRVQRGGVAPRTSEVELDAHGGTSGDDGRHLPGVARQILGAAAQFRVKRDRDVADGKSLLVPVRILDQKAQPPRAPGRGDEARARVRTESIVVDEQAVIGRIRI